MDNQRLEIRFLPISQACKFACHYKRATEHALDEMRERENPQNILQLLSNGLHTIPWRFRTSRRYVFLPCLCSMGAANNDKGAFLAVFRRTHPNIPITAYLRSTALDTALTALGNVTIVRGTFEEHDKIQELSAAHSIVINCAASFNPPVTEAILRGIRTTKSSSKPILLHLSGTGNFVDHSKLGSYIPQEHPFNDRNPDQVRKIDASYPPNGACDGLILAAAAKGEVNAFFVCPGGIYGTSTNHIGLTIGAASAKAPGVWVLWNMENVQDLGFSPYVGPGTSIIRLVHVDDVVDLMVLVLQKALDTWSTYQPEDVYSNFYIAVNDTPAEAKPVAEAYAELLFRMGKIASPIAKQVTYEEAGKVAG